MNTVTQLRRYAKLESNPEGGLQVESELYARHSLVYYMSREDAVASSRSGNSTNLRRGSLPLGWAPFLPVRSTRSGIGLLKRKKERHNFNGFSVACHDDICVHD